MVMSVLPKLKPCPPVPNRNVEIEFWVKEEKKKSFIPLSDKGSYSRLMFERLSPLLRKSRKWIFNFGSGK